MTRTRGTLLSGSILLLASFAVGQTAHVNHANWKLSDRFSQEFVNRLVGSLTVTPHFVNETDTFWYNWKDRNGVRFMIVDPRARTKKPLFDSAKMASMLSVELHKPFDTTNLPIGDLAFAKDGKSITFNAENTKFEYYLDSGKLISRGPVKPAATTPATEGGGQQQQRQGQRRGNRGGGGGGGAAAAQGGPRPQNSDYKNFSPDKKSYVYAQGNNLFYVDVAAEDKPIQLSKDGAPYYTFGGRSQFFGGTNGDDQSNDQRKVNAAVTWSKDSKYFYIPRYDSRKVGELWLVDNLAEPRPKLQTYKYAMPGEENVTQTEFFTFDRDKKDFKKVDLVKYKDGALFSTAWTEEGSKIRFVRRDRLQRNMEFCEYDPATDKTAIMITEKIEDGFLDPTAPRYVKPGGEILWWSERDGWGHIYRYDKDGKPLGRLTEGSFRVESIVDVDEKRGFVWFKATGKEANENPYYHHTYRVKMDGSGLTLLDEGDGEHSTTLSPSKNFAVDSYSRVNMVPVNVVRDDRGRPIIDLETPDLGALKDAGWKGAEMFMVKAGDGVTDIYGDMWKPFDFDPKKKYPIILNVYPGPQTESVQATFSAFSTTQRLANLGFIVIQVGNRGGNPARSKAYHSYGYYNLRDYGLEDKKVAVEQLAAKYPWINMDKVGIFGHSGGGFMSSAALMVPPYNDFFKVAVSSSGNHDNNIYNQNWSEQHHGLTETKSFLNGSKFSIHVPTNIEVAANLKGKLLLVTGDMDNNVHPANTVRLVNALIKAGKRFDYMIMPGKQHGYADLQPYFTQLLMEYFAEHLMGDYYRDSADLKDKN